MKLIISCVIATQRNLPRWPSDKATDNDRTIGMFTRNILAQRLWEYLDLTVLKGSI